MIRRLRVIVLSVILLVVGLGTLLDRLQTTDWDGPLLVALYPINADGSESAARELAAPRTAVVDELELFFAREAMEHGLSLDRPLRFTLAPSIAELPPAIPTQGGMLRAIFWSLRMRWWNFRVDDPAGPTPTIRLYLVFHDPARSPSVPHSAGLQKGLVGVAHLFAADHMAGSNRVVIAHELLHTLGATDKYEPSSLQPRFPDGFAEPARSPRFPQSFAELMAGRIPLSESESLVPETLEQVLIGPATAMEIGWGAGR